MQHRSRKFVRRWISFVGECGNLGTAGILETHEFGGFIKRLASCIVARATDDAIAAEVAHEDEFGVPTGNDEDEEWVLPMHAIFLVQPC